MRFFEVHTYIFMKIFNIYIEIADISFENDIAFFTFFTHAFFIEVNIHQNIHYT